MIVNGKEECENFWPLHLNFTYVYHTTYTRNNMGQKCGGNCGLWVLNEIIKKLYPENLKKIVGALWELPAKQHSQSSPFPLKLGWIGCAI